MSEDKLSADNQKRDESKRKALENKDFLKERASRANAEKFDVIMAKVSDIEPEPHDTLE